MRRLLLFAVFIALCGAAAALYVGDRLTVPALHAVGPPPHGLPAVAVAIAGKDRTVRGWYIAGKPGRNVVLLLHALRADRRSMIGRARFLHRAGYGLLAIDFQAHGESPGERITFGYNEAHDATAAARYLKDRFPDAKLGVIGISLGGAAALLGKTVHLADALVLESVYPTLRRAVENRIAIRLGDAGRLLAPLLLCQIEPRLGFDPGTLAPIERISEIDSPVMIVGGTADRHTTEADTQALFDKARAPKSLWIVDGAGHADFHARSRQEYEKRILEFLARHLH